MLDVRAIFEEFGGTRPLHETLVERLGDYAPSLDTVRKWLERNSIPGEWLIAVLALREVRASHPVSVLGFLTGDGGWQISRRKPSHTGGSPSVFD